MLSKFNMLGKKPKVILKDDAKIIVCLRLIQYSGSLFASPASYAKVGVCKKRKELLLRNRSQVLKLYYALR